jgi:hypothetical protein
LAGTALFATASCSLSGWRSVSRSLDVNRDQRSTGGCQSSWFVYDRIRQRSITRTRW